MHFWLYILGFFFPQKRCPFSVRVTNLVLCFVYNWITIPNTSRWKGNCGATRTASWIFTTFVNICTWISLCNSGHFFHTMPSHHYFASFDPNHRPKKWYTVPFFGHFGSFSHRTVCSGPNQLMSWWNEPKCSNTQVTGDHSCHSLARCVLQCIS